MLRPQGSGAAPTRGARLRLAPGHPARSREPALSPTGDPARGHVALPDTRLRRGGAALRPQPGPVRRPAGRRQRTHGGDRGGHSRGGDGVPAPRVLGARRVRGAGGGDPLRREPRGRHRTRRALVPDRGALLGGGGLVRNAGRHRRERAHRERGPDLDRPGPARGLRRRVGDGDVRGRARDPGPVGVVPLLHPGGVRSGRRSPGTGAAGAVGVQPRRVLDRALRPGGRRHLHQVGRRRRRPGGQGRSGDSRGRPAQPGGDRGQRRRQRR